MSAAFMEISVSAFERCIYEYTRAHAHLRALTHIHVIPTGNAITSTAYSTKRDPRISVVTILHADYSDDSA